MTSRLALLLCLVLLGGCMQTVADPQSALRPYYAGLPAALPVAPPTKALDPDAPLTRIGVGSCFQQDLADDIWTTVAQSGAGLFLFIGDNVYGDVGARVRPTSRSCVQPMQNSPPAPPSHRRARPSPCGRSGTTMITAPMTAVATSRSRNMPRRSSRHSGMRHGRSGRALACMTVSRSVRQAGGCR
ncbi:hypothetical protein E6W36_06625 [Hankyongella ginsenosidimutans]|uniref:Uncharacterized protein n=1 Tax=Hankyongella ginsenosidimutans TaxID=1763828 RepID=A0A4D7CBX9_9SPHN|nr:hypothetical protein [Hankyongella ginsenosidimutans]QCI79342.1 hypothetical protein E6W36_06625 [Hankyongella ginsenosidimutans]